MMDLKEIYKKCDYDFFADYFRKEYEFWIARGDWMQVKLCIISYCVGYFGMVNKKLMRLIDEAIKLYFDIGG